jgi:hypothetical protein
VITPSTRLTRSDQKWDRGHLVAAEPTPLAWALAFVPHESPAEMALVDKAAGECNFRQFKLVFEQQVLRALDTPFHQPLMWRDASGSPKSARKVAWGQAT